jgi:hypothetical protein
MHIEQAIFTSARTDTTVGYQVVAHSPGIHRHDLRELVIWCPSHDSLLEQSADAVSLNFHPLPSGAYCLSRTVPAGWEYSGRGGVRVYTHCLIARPEVLERFANNPFALLRAAESAGTLEIRDPVPAQLEELSLSDEAATVDQSLLTRLCSQPGPQAMATLIQAALDAACLAVAGESSPGELFAGLFSCLPPICRLEFSFSTGLKFSGRRPFHLIALSKDPGEQRWIAHQNNVTVLDLTPGKPLPKIPISGWARFIQQVLTSGRTPFLAAHLSKYRLNLKCDDLPAFGLQLLEDLETSAFSDLPRTGGGGKNAKEIQQAHAAHRQFQKTRNQSENQTAHVAVEAPSAALRSESPEMQEKFELLDDLVFDAIGGRPGALEQLLVLWPTLREDLDRQMLAESREQYLRYALTIWEDCVDENNIRNPAKAVQALDVLCLLFEE